MPRSIDELRWLRDEEDHEGVTYFSPSLLIRLGFLHGCIGSHAIFSLNLLTALNSLCVSFFFGYPFLSR